MQELYATLLLHEAKLPINEENLTKVLQSVGVVPDQARLKALVASLEGQNIDELIKQAAVVSAPAAGGATEKKEEKKAEEEKKAAEEASAGLSALFG
jgi:large subunit ribosomal protein L12